MNDSSEIAREWLDHEDQVTRDQRPARLGWLADQVPTVDSLTFPGGWVAWALYEEARYCFAYGQFMATIVLALAFIERTTAAIYYAAGRNDLERASASKLLEEARKSDWLSEDEFLQIDQVRTLRNPITHFRAPLTSDTIEARALAQQEVPYALLESDAKMVMRAAFHILSKNSY